MNKISVVIPTLQKNPLFLKDLLHSLEHDDAVSEIIVIDNSCRGLDFCSGKLKVIVPEANIFVNPAWNRGVREAREEIVALLNDDICIPDDFCSAVAKQMTPTMGILGMARDFVQNISPASPYYATLPPSAVYLEPAPYIAYNYGVAMFFHKSAFVEIPDKILIWYGDHWIFEKARKLGRQNYFISGVQIQHCTSSTSKSFISSPLHKNDRKYYKKLMYNFFNRLFRFRRTAQGYEVVLFGITF